MILTTENFRVPNNDNAPVHRPLEHAYMYVDLLLNNLQYVDKEAREDVILYLSENYGNLFMSVDSLEY